MNEYLIMLKEDLIKEMSHHDAKDDVHEREWKQTMTAFWDMFEHGTYVTTVTCPIYQDDTSSLFSGVTTTIQQVDSNSSGKISSVTGGEYDTNYNLREDNITVCNESSLANIHIS